MKLRWVWPVLAILFLAARYQNTPGVLTRHGVEVNDTDPYYRLHRIEQMVRGDVSYPLHDPDLAYPTGLDVPWPTGLDLLLALPLKVAGVRSQETIERFSALAIPVLALPTIWIMGALGGFTLGSVGAVGAAFMIAFSPPAIYAGAVGRVDHHFLECMLTALALLGLASALRGRARFGEWTLALLFGLGPGFWPQAWMTSLFVALSALFSRDVRQSLRLERIYFAGSLCSLIPLALSSRFGTGLVSVFGFSWWPPLLYAFLAVFFLLIRPTGAQKDRGFKAAISVYAALLLAFLMFRNGLAFLPRAVSASVDALRAEQGTMATTSETLYTFLIPVRLWPGLGLLPLVLAWIWFTWQSFHRKRWWLAGFFMGPLILSFVQARFISVAAPVMILASLLLLNDMIHRFYRDERNHPWVFLSLVLLLSLPSLPRAQLTHEGNHHPFFSAVREASTFLRQRSTAAGLRRSDTAVAGSWDFGHWILHDADAPVVANPFQDATSLETVNLFCSESSEALDRFVARHPVRYLMLETPTRRFEHWLLLAGRDPMDVFKSRRDSDSSFSIVARPRFYRMMLPRFFLRNGADAHDQFPSAWRLIYVGPVGFFGKPGAPAIKVFERVPGARIRVRTRQPQLDLLARIKSTEGEIVFRQTGKADSHGYVEWLFPYAKAEAGGVKYDGRVSLWSADGRHSEPSATVEEQDVLQNRFVDLGDLRW
ncbi:MAG: hypothetical protein V1798_11305 [Pseudomonadota bacterium]